MQSSNHTDTYTPPVRCPQCGERQNRFSGGLATDSHAFDKIDCMVCGHVFDRDEYQELLTQAQTELTSTP